MDNSVIWNYNFLGGTGEFQVVLDRRLYQDDNRGLGQGVTDNKITPANFRLVVERFKSPHEPVSRNRSISRRGRISYW